MTKEQADKVQSLKLLLEYGKAHFQAIAALASVIDQSFPNDYGAGHFDQTSTTCHSIVSDIERALEQLYFATISASRDAFEETMRKP